MLPSLALLLTFLLPLILAQGGYEVPESAVPDASYVGEAPRGPVDAFVEGTQEKRFIQPDSPVNFAPDSDVDISLQVPVAVVHGQRTIDGVTVIQDSATVHSTRGSRLTFEESEAGGALGGLLGQAEEKRTSDEPTDEPAATSATVVVDEVETATTQNIREEKATSDEPSSYEEDEDEEEGVAVAPTTEAPVPQTEATQSIQLPESIEATEAVQATAEPTEESAEEPTGEPTEQPRVESIEEPTEEPTEEPLEPLPAEVPTSNVIAGVPVSAAKISETSNLQELPESIGDGRTSRRTNRGHREKTPKVPNLSYQPPPPPVRREIVMAPRCSFDTDKWSFHPESAVTDAVMFERQTGLTCEECLARCAHRQSGPWTCRSLTFDSSFNICDLYAVKANGAPYNLVDYAGRDYFEYNLALPPTDEELSAVNEFDVTQKSTAATSIINCEVKSLKKGRKGKKLAGVATQVQAATQIDAEAGELVEPVLSYGARSLRKEVAVESEIKSAEEVAEVEAEEEQENIASKTSERKESNLEEEEFFAEESEAEKQKNVKKVREEKEDSLRTQFTKEEKRQEELSRVPKVKSVHIARELSSREVREGFEAANRFNQRSQSSDKERREKEEKEAAIKEKVAAKARERAEAAEARARAQFELLEHQRLEQESASEAASEQRTVKKIRKVVMKKVETQTEKKFSERNGQVIENSESESSSSSSSSKTSSGHGRVKRVRVHGARTLARESDSGVSYQKSKAAALEDKLSVEHRNSRSTSNASQPIHEVNEEVVDEKIRGGELHASLHTEFDANSKNDSDTQESSSSFSGAFSENSESNLNGVHETSSKSVKKRRLRKITVHKLETAAGFCEKENQRVAFVEFAQTETAAKAEVGRPATSGEECAEECARDAACASAVFSEGECHVAPTAAKFGDEAALSPSIKSLYFYKTCLPKDFLPADRRRFVAVQNEILVGHVEEVADARNLQHCITLCLRASKKKGFTCHSVMFYPNDKDQNCLLNRESRLSNPRSFVAEEAGVQMLYVDMQREEDVGKLQQGGDFRRDEPLETLPRGAWTVWSDCNGKTREEMHFRYLKCTEKDIRKCPKESAFCGGSGIRGGPLVQRLSVL